MAKTPSKKTAKKAAPTKKTTGGNKKKRVETYSSYIYKVLKSTLIPVSPRRVCLS
jgi:hypothetical protein